MSDPEATHLPHAVAVAMLKERSAALRHYADTAVDVWLRELLHCVAYLIDCLAPGDPQSPPSRPSDVDLLPMAYLRGPDRTSPAKTAAKPHPANEPGMIWSINPGHKPEIPDGWEFAGVKFRDGSCNFREHSGWWVWENDRFTHYAIRPKSPAEQPAPADFGAATDPAALDARFAKLEQTVSEQSTLIQALNSQPAGAADDSKIARILAEADGQIAALKVLQDVLGQVRGSK